AENEYLVQISKGTHPENVERALAHELAEIAMVHRGRKEVPDALAPQSTATQLSPHDHGRLAELEGLGRRFSELPPDSPAKKGTLDEAERLVSRLGLTAEGEVPAARRELARTALGDGPGRAMLDNAVETARNNPFLQRLTGEFADDLRLLERRLQHAR